MQFALLGNHPDGINLAAALVGSGRHQLLACTHEDPRLQALAGQARRVADVEEILADPAIEVIVVASKVRARPDQLRRALQSERHVLCLHPAGDGPEIAYEAGMIRDDVRRVLFPVLPAATHPAFHRLAHFVCRKIEASADAPLGAFLLLAIERATPSSQPPGVQGDVGKMAFPDWELLRAIGGDVAELSAFAAEEEVGPDDPVVLTGKFERGGLFQTTLLPNQAQPSLRLTVIGNASRAELLFPAGGDGPAMLDWTDAAGTTHEEYWDAWDPWPTLVAAFEAAVAGRPTPVNWQDAVRALELDDAARRSLARRRTSLLEYAEATEEVGFKGTMTLVGCGVLWGVLLLLILAAWVPWLKWIIAPLLVAFLGLQLLRFVLPTKRDEPS